MLDTMARQGEYSDYARVAAPGPATGTPPAVPIALSAAMPTQNERRISRGGRGLAAVAER